MIIPKVSLLEQLIFSTVRSAFPNKNLTQVDIAHPKIKTDLVSSTGRIVIGQIAEQAMGKFITRRLLRPTFQLVTYAGTYPLTRNLQESLLEVIESWNSETFPMEKQKVETLNIVRITAPILLPESGLYVAIVDLNFHLSSGE